MHEMGIADSILSAVRTEAERHPGARVRTVGLRIGEYAGVDSESLRFCFDVLKKDTGFEGATLEIETRPEAVDLDLCYLELEDGEK